MTVVEPYSLAQIAERLAEAANTEPGSLHDLVVRRLLPAHEVAGPGGQVRGAMR